ncbi:Rieske (2Fe-2S) protein [Aestuariicella hydrocarbonica]|uniref:Rieske (2Fe-2S) protein n=2 Tax=Pseudomaricurvus hydrocarbonicus TaxID=1470433 RepID=A0A9E5MMG5_9GAMM|nr:Rieske (2Fe-2S) protein [Aestuariicella hydrocarbonica]
MIFLCPLQDLSNHQSKGFSLNEQPIFVIRQNQKVYAYRNRCPHLGIQLEWLPDKFLDIDGDLIQCATHGALFSIDDGYCVSGPCGGQSLQALAVDIREGEVWVETPPAERR